MPEAVEGIAYRIPGYKLHGKPLLYFAAFTKHYSLFAASGMFFATLEEELSGCDVRKGTVHFPLTEPVPLKRIARLRAAGITAARKKGRRGRRGPVRRGSRFPRAGNFGSGRTPPDRHVWSDF
ncbi:MAG: hypothetical protein JWN34_1322 [Bryobacterales bacterium]|nr:hypothetical protein [Bryobacterales bacterium]